MRQLGGGGNELAVGAGAEAAGAAGAVEAGVRDGAWREEVAGAGAGTGVKVGAEEAAGADAWVEAEDELDLDPGETLWVSSAGPLKNKVSVSFYSHHFVRGRCGSMSTFRN